MTVVNDFHNKSELGENVLIWRTLYVCVCVGGATLVALKGGNRQYQYYQTNWDLPQLFACAHESLAL